MNYAKLVNAIGAVMQIDARTFTRYNKSVTHGEGDDAGVSARDAKFVVVDYKDTETSFHIRAGQIHFNGASVTIDMLIEKIMEEDPSLKIHSNIEEAVKESIGEKYLVAAQDIMNLAKAYVEERNNDCHIKIGTFVNSDRDPGVSIFVQCADENVIITITE